MSAIRVVIADDEPIARRGIRALLATYTDVQIVGEARHGSETAQMVLALRPDVLFLDVQMPELDGFQVLQAAGERAARAVIFVTAFDTFAVKAFEADAIDYLVKPINEQRFQKAFNKVRDRLASQEALELSERIAGLRSGEASLDGTHGHASRRIVVTSGGTDVLLEPKDIEWIESEDYYAAIYSGGRRYLLRESLASLLGRLDAHSFVRVHRTAIVNLAHVREVQNDSDGRYTLLLRSGVELPLSRRRRAQVNKSLNTFANQLIKK